MNMLKFTDSLDIDGINAQRAFEQNPEAQFSRKEQMRDLCQLAAKYPLEVFYDLLVLHLVQGYSLDEIANLKGLTKSAVVYKIEGSIKFLRKKIQQRKRWGVRQ